VRAYLTYVTYRLISALVGRLPPRMGYWLANRAGVLLYQFYPGLQQIVTDNMRHVLGPEASEQAVQAAARQACANIAKGHYELFRLPRLTLDDICDLVQVEGMEYVQSTLGQGRGVVITSAHVGNVDIVSQFPATYGLSLVGAAQHIKPERLFRYLLRVRQKHGLRLIPSDESMLPLFRALKRGGIVALPSDRDIADHGQVVKFFGAPTRLPDGPVRVALRTGAALIPAFV
jgi:lauroyl/myristoyl acyltransferase